MWANRGCWDVVITKASGIFDNLEYRRIFLRSIIRNWEKYSQVIRIVARVRSIFTIYAFNGMIHILREIGSQKLKFERFMFFSIANCSHHSFIAWILSENWTRLLCLLQNMFFVEDTIYRLSTDSQYIYQVIWRTFDESIILFAITRIHENFHVQSDYRCSLTTKHLIG